MSSNLYDSMVGVQETLRSAFASEFDTTNIKLAKVDPERESKFPGFPGMLVMHVGAERVRPGTNERDDVGYPVAVILFDRDRGDGTGTPGTTGTQDQVLYHAKRLEWRETIRRTLRSKPQTVRANGGPACCYHVECIPQEIVVPRKWLADNLWVSAQLFVVWNRETRL